MTSIRNSCRPKHQVLVLKCYPRFQKNQTSIKPNGSELSYLLYYASTRPSKLQKVGAFLEKRTVSDVWHVRVGSVQVSLQIVSALIEKCPRDLPLFAGSVLSVLANVLKSGDAAMVEAAGQAWEDLCRVQDPTVLAADQGYIRQYEEVVQLHVGYASKEKPHQMAKGGAANVPMAMRFRKIGLEAIKCIAGSESVTAEAAWQLKLTVPVVLENLYSTDATYLTTLQQREYMKDQAEKEMAMRRRQSDSIVRTADDGSADPLAALGTTADADMLAEQDVGVVALQALRRIFSGGNRGQLRLATSAGLNFIATHVRPQEHFETREYQMMGLGSWPTNLFAIISSWAPVQDRFVILVTAMETLIRSPIVEGDLEKKYVFATVIGWLLASSINFIGLSVMDVLIGLMQHVSLLLQLGGPDSEMKAHQHQADILDEGVGSVKANPLPTPADADSHRGSNVVLGVAQAPSEMRVKLLNQLIWCISNLATHVYYTDQISDMIMAIMKRLRPSSPSSSTASAMQDPNATAETLARTASRQERPGTDAFFSFDTARSATLQAVKGILMVANGRAPDGTSNTINRSQIGTSVWEGTQWLLRDPNPQIRVGYHDALVTWLNLELKKRDLRVQEHTPKRSKSQKREAVSSKVENLSRRAVSNATHREKSPCTRRSTFIDLVHVAIYDNAHQFAESEQDIVLLHSLNCAMIQKLGVNSIRSGFPMIMRLQDDVDSIGSRTARINIASLCYGYIWAISCYLDFDASQAGRGILEEISARTKAHTWLQSVRVPPMMPHQISQSELGPSPPEGPRPGTALSSEEKNEREILRPFDNCVLLVDKIAQGYSMSLYSPPTSPPGSPSRSFSQPMHGHGGRSRSISVPGQALNFRTPSPNRAPPELPPTVRDDILADWSKEACLAAVTQASLRSVSGSKASGRDTSNSVDAVSRAKKLAAAVAPVATNGSGSLDGTTPALLSADHVASQRLSQQPQTPTHSHRTRRSASRSAPITPSPLNSSSVHPAVRVDDLKRVLAGTAAGGGALGTAWSMRGSTSYGRRRGSSRSSLDDSESLVSVGADMEDTDCIDFAIPENVHVPRPPGMESPAPVDESADEAAGEQETGMERQWDREGSTTPRPVEMTSNAGHSHQDSQRTIIPFRPKDEAAEGGVESTAAGGAFDSMPPPVSCSTHPNLRMPTSTSMATASSVYSTPAEEFPAPLGSHIGTETPTANGNHAVATPSHAQRRDELDDTVKRPWLDTAGYDTDTSTASSVEQPTSAQTAVVAVSGRGQDVYNGRRSMSVRSTSSNVNAQSRRGSAVRSSSSGAGAANANAGAQTARGGRGMGGGVGAAGTRGGKAATAGRGESAGDVRSLLSEIEVDSWDRGARGLGKVPY